MAINRSIDFFERQFRRQEQRCDVQLNPFETLALPHLRGRVLDLGCGMGNLSLAAARRGCTVVALDASETAIAHLSRTARDEGLPINAVQTDLLHYQIAERFDTIVSIGLLMFFDWPNAKRLLDEIKAGVAGGGTAIVNVLVKGTTYMDMFDPSRHCLFATHELAARFKQWCVVHEELRDFAAPNSTTKRFSTLIVRKPSA